MMNFNLSIFNFFLLVLCTMHKVFPFANGQSPKVEPVCIDDLEDFERSHWILGKGSYAENTDALSNILQHEIESANGIFYFVGPSSDNAIVSDLNSDHFPSPTFMYVKYYGYLPSQMHESIIVAPPFDNSDGPLKFLPNTPGLEWGEAVIEMDNNPPFPAPFEVAALNVGSGEYFLVDKIIILHEDLGQDFEAIRAKCPPTETTSTDTPSTTVPTEPTSTSTSTTSTTSTSTESPSVPFSCQEPGFFRGADCSTFHVCLFEKSGVFGNLMFHCPTPQVWCQSSWRCEDAQVCPCSI